VDHEQIEAARQRMLQAQKELADYRKFAESNTPDRKRFNQLYSRVSVCTQEYLDLVIKYFSERYEPRNYPKAESDESDAMAG
jgi:hypothetical protein